ncbi:MAG: putative transporter, type 2 [Clostridia bacterium]|jgi:ABC-2 type transport system permease protein|nr:putative transporter, type 2 [Clostridia bacterium]
MDESCISIYESIKEEIQKMKIDKLIIIIGLIMPILINLLISWELSKGVIDHIPMAVVDYDDSQLSRQIIQYFSDNDSFDLAYYADNQEALQSLIDESKVKVGMVIPERFSEEVTSLQSPSILMLYDGSHMSITSVAKAKASEILMTIRTGAAIKQLEGRLNMTEEEAYHTGMPISFESRTLYNPARNFAYFMLPGYGTMVCQTGIALTAVLCINLIIGTNQKRDVLGYTIGKIIFYGTMGSIAIITNILAQIVLFKLPFRGSFIIAIILSIALAFAVSSLSIAVSSWIKNRVTAMAVIGLMIIPNSVMIGYTWPIMSMVPFYKIYAKTIPYYYYGDNIRNLFLKGNVTNLGGDIGFLILFTLSMLFIAIMGIYAGPNIKPREVFKKWNYSLEAFRKK